MSILLTHLDKNKTHAPCEIDDNCPDFGNINCIDCGTDCLLRFQAQKIVRWLYEPCKEHATIYNLISGKTFDTVKHKDCPECMNELKREVE